MGVHDLNFGSPICDACRSERPGVAHECRQDAVCTGDGVRTVEDLRTHHRASQRRCRRSHAGLRRLVPRDGVLPAHLARVASRHRGLPCGQSSQAVSHGPEGVAGPLDFGRCVEFARLAYLPRAGPATHCPRQGLVFQGPDGCWTSMPVSMRWTPPRSIFV